MNLGPVLQTKWDIRAVGNWVGGGTGTGVIIAAAVLTLSGIDSYRFSLAGIVLVAAGLFSASRRGVMLTDPFASTYGQWVARKAVLTVVAVGLGGVSRFVVLPQLRRGAPTDHPGGISLFRRVITVEVGLVAAVMLFAAVLTQTPPSGTVSMATTPMHHPPMEHQQAR